MKWNVLVYWQSKLSSKHGNNNTYILDSVHCDLILFQLNVQPKSVLMDFNKETTHRYNQNGFINIQ